MSEAIERFKAIVAGFDARVQAAPADAWDNQSPCAEWKARDVVRHVSNGMRNLSGGQLPPLGDGDDAVAAWPATRDGVMAGLERADLSMSVNGPFGPMPLEQLIGRLMCTDVMVHTWDLARAVGGDERLPDDFVHQAYSGLKPMDAMIRQPGVFDAKRDVPTGADEQAEFLSFLGRQV